MKKIVFVTMTLGSLLSFSQENTINGPDESPGRVNILTAVRGYGHTKSEAKEYMKMGCETDSSRTGLKAGRLVSSSVAKTFCYEEYGMTNCLGVCNRPNN